MQEDSKRSLKIQVLRFAPLLIVVVLATIVVVRSGPAAITAYIESYRENALVTAAVKIGRAHV